MLPMTLFQKSPGLVNAPPSTSQSMTTTTTTSASSVTISDHSAIKVTTSTKTTLMSGLSRVPWFLRMRMKNEGRMPMK